jgi:protein ImuB
LFGCLRSTRRPETIVQIAQDFSPRIQRYGAAAVVLDISGLGRLLGSPDAIGAELARAAGAQDRTAIRVAVAPTQTAALLLSLSHSALTVVTSDEAAAVASLPLSVLHQVAVMVQPSVEQADDEIFDVLRRWGLKRIGEFAALPSADLPARLGQRGSALQQLARAVDPHPLVPHPGVRRFVERMELEWPIDTLEPLSFVFARLLDPLASALERGDRAAASMRLQLRLVDRTVHERMLQLPAAIRDARVLRTLLLLDLEAHPPPAAVDIVTIEADPAPSRIIQYSLLERATPSAETLATLNARLYALVGEARCGSPELLDSHRPDAFVLRRFPPPPLRGSGAASPERPAPPGDPLTPSAQRDGGPAWRRFRPPVAVRVALARGRPAHVAIDRRGMPGGAVVQAAGPWRSSGAWWDRDRQAWDRDEWDVECVDRVICRLFHDRGTGVWFLDGIVD